MNSFLEGKQIYLRPFGKADVPIWYDWFNSPEVTEHMNKGAFPFSDDCWDIVSYRRIDKSLDNFFEAPLQMGELMLRKR